MTDHYDQNLRHMAEPSKPSERRDTPSVTLADYEALYYANILREYGEYETGIGEERSIALGYVEYINQQVRERESSTVDFYAHTKTAANVLGEALMYADRAYVNDIFGEIEDEVQEFVLENGTL